MTEQVVDSELWLPVSNQGWRRRLDPSFIMSCQRYGDIFQPLLRHPQGHGKRFTGFPLSENQCPHYIREQVSRITVANFEPSNKALKIMGMLSSTETAYKIFSKQYNFPTGVKNPISYVKLFRCIFGKQV